MPYLLDSDVLIDVSRGKQPARECLDALPEGWAISQVSALELIVGARDGRDLTAIDPSCRPLWSSRSGNPPARD